MVNALSALLTPTIAFLGCYIAWQQWRVNELRLKHSLFKKRYGQFEATRDFLASIMTRGKVLADEKLKWSQAIRGARFTFGESIAAYFEEIFQKSNALEYLESTFDFNAPAQVRSQNVERQEEIKRWFEAEWRKNLEDRFAQHLELKFKHPLGAFLIGTGGVLGTIAVALFLMQPLGAASSHFQLLAGLRPASDVVFRLDRSSGQICTYRSWYDEAKQDGGLRRITCLTEGLPDTPPAIVPAPTKP